MLDELTLISQTHLLKTLQTVIEEIERTSAILSSTNINFVPRIYDLFAETAPYFDIQEIMGHFQIVLTGFYRFGAPAHNASRSNECVFSMVTPSLLEQIEMALLRAQTQMEIYNAVLSNFQK